MSADPCPATGYRTAPILPLRKKLTLLEALDRAGGPPAEALFFAIEDARQERQGLAYYPGARSVLEDLYRASLTGALSRHGPLARFAVACFMTVGGYLDDGLLERRLDARSGAAWRDAMGILEKAAAADDPWEVADLAMRLLTVAEVHGPRLREPTRRATLEATRA